MNSLARICTNSQYKDKWRRSFKSTLIRLCWTFLIFLFLGGITSAVVSANPVEAVKPMESGLSSGLVYQKVIVRPGDTIWELAAEISDYDTRFIVNETIRYNRLKSTYIQTGQVLYIPVKF